MIDSSGVKGTDTVGYFEFLAILENSDFLYLTGLCLSTSKFVFF